MLDIDLEYSLMLEGRLNLMHLPSGVIAWLWDRPRKQVDAAENIATAAKAYDNPVVDASLLRADQNILLLKCEGGECFRIYPDGGYSYENTPMDMGGCSAVLRGDWCGCPHSATETNPLADDEHDSVGIRMGEKKGWNDEHMDDEEPTAAQGVPANMTNLAGEPTMDEEIGGDWGGPGTGDGMGTGGPYVDFVPDEELQSLLNDQFDTEEFEKECRGYSDEEMDEIAKAMDTYESVVEAYHDEDPPQNLPDKISLEVYDDSTDSVRNVVIGLDWYVQPTEYEGPYTFAHGSVELEDMRLLKPVELNNTMHETLNPLLAQRILDFIGVGHVEQTKAIERLRDYIETREAEEYKIPNKTYPVFR